jgi:hypothetical protein
VAERLISSRQADARRQICRECTEQCGAYQSGTLNYEDPQEECPRLWPRRWGSYSPKPQVVPATAAAPSIFVPRLKATWLELHLRSLHHDGSDDSLWLMNDFAPRVAQIGCSCRSHFLALLQRIPPRWHDYFACGVEWHNDINLRLGKPCITVAEALQLYRNHV